MAEINLVRAFILRKRLRSIIDSITFELRKGKTYIKVSNAYPDGTVVNENEKPFEYKGKNLYETYELLCKADNYMLELNNSIDDANNVKARKIINKLELEKGKVFMLRSLADNRKHFSETDSFYDSAYKLDNKNGGCGGVITTSYRLTDNFDWEKEARDCKKNIVALEDKLSEVNSVTTLNIPDDILSFIEENI